MKNREILDSWKEIADYLGRSEKTCRRLEKELGLPVHRLEVSPKARVFAYTDELDRWIEKTKHSEKKDFVKSSHVKRILILISVVSVFAAAILIWQFLPQKTLVPSRQDKISIAVLPFEDLSPNKDLEHLCDGISEELIIRLTSIGKLKVPARASAFSFKNKGLDVNEIGRKLDVAYVLDGSVRKAGNKLRFTVQLVDVKEGYPIWSEKFERDEKDIFALQDEISFAVVDLLKINLLEAESKRLKKHHTENVEAYNLYLMGRHYVANYTSEARKKAINYYERALQEDPNFALAYLGLASVYMSQSLDGSIPPNEVYPKVKSYTQRAQEKDDTLAEVFAYMGAINTFYDWNFEQAEKDFQKALSLNQDSSYIHWYYALFLNVTRRQEESISEIRRVLELDPLNPIFNAALGLGLFTGGYYSEAFEVLKNVIKTYPYLASAHFYLGELYYKKSMLDEAISELEKAVELGGERPTHVVVLAKAYYDAGKENQAKELFDSLMQRSNLEYISPMIFFYIHHFQGNKDQALESVKRACEEHEGLVVWGRVHPVEEWRIPDTPRFNKVLKKYGLDKQFKTKEKD